MVLSKLWKEVEPKKIVEGVVAYENCIEVPEGVVDIMNSEVDRWKDMVLKTKQWDRGGNYQTVKNQNGPIRFDPETEFVEKESKEYFWQVQRNTLDKVNNYKTLYPQVADELHWMEQYQYITYKPPKFMNYHGDNRSTRNPETGRFWNAPFLRRITVLTYLTDYHQGGALDFEYFEHEPYKPPAGSVVIMPSAFVYSHATTPLLNGRKSAFLVACSSGFDLDSFLDGVPPEELTRRQII